MEVDLNDYIVLKGYYWIHTVCTLTSCKENIADLSKQSFSIVRWNTETQSNELVAIFCTAYHMTEYLNEEVSL